MVSFEFGLRLKSGLRCRVRVRVRVRVSVSGWVEVE